MNPKCYDCLSEDVVVKVIDPFGFEHWFCAADWDANQRFYEKFTAMVENAVKDFLAVSR